MQARGEEDDAAVREGEALLRAAAPAAEARWSADLERRLLPARRVRPRAVTWGLGLAATGAAAVAIAAVALVGGLATGTGADDAIATQPCETVYVTDVEPVGEVRRGPDGVVRVETVRRPVVRAVERCR